MLKRFLIVKSFTVWTPSTLSNAVLTWDRTIGSWRAQLSISNIFLSVSMHVNNKALVLYPGLGITLKSIPILIT